MNKEQKIGLIGAGLMGRGIGKTLLEKGFELSVVAHRNREGIEDLVERGASEFSNCRELAAASDVIITCLPSMAAVHSVFEGPDGIIDNGTAGLVIIDTTTSDPVVTRNLQIKAKSKGILLVDAPLLGGPKMTWEGTISIVVGGEDTAIEAARGILEGFAKNLFFTGGPGTGHTVKLINNAVTLTNSAILYETFTVAQKMGVNLDTLYQAMDASMASSKRLHAIAPALIADEHPKSFALDTATKDLVLYSEVAGASGVPVLLGEAAKTQYRLAQSLGFGDQSVTRIATALADIGGTSFGEK
ncbi:MAG: NAD(P)-dependent oxidoreductase [Oceanospirillaceae bacterium]|nr:NAD(P)-dependent oxidoreductase [Oceanospirillaceae bacterium]